LGLRIWSLLFLNSRSEAPSSRSLPIFFPVLSLSRSPLGRPCKTSIATEVYRPQDAPFLCVVPLCNPSSCPLEPFVTGVWVFECVRRTTFRLTFPGFTPFFPSPKIVPPGIPLKIVIPFSLPTRRTLCGHTLSHVDLGRELPSPFFLVVDRKHLTIALEVDLQD